MTSASCHAVGSVFRVGGSSPAGNSRGHPLACSRDARWAAKNQLMQLVQLEAASDEFTSESAVVAAQEQFNSFSMRRGRARCLLNSRMRSSACCWKVAVLPR